MKATLHYGRCAISTPTSQFKLNFTVSSAFRHFRGILSLTSPPFCAIISWCDKDCRKPGYTKSMVVHYKLKMIWCPNAKVGIGYIRIFLAPLEMLCCQDIKTKNNALRPGNVNDTLRWEPPRCTTYFAVFLARESTYAALRRWLSALFYFFCKILG